jgi:chromosome segregation ATPase
MNTVEAQIREARERADMFASSLNKAKEQEGYFEEERQKWVLSFEEKSSMIEQLERELTSTVDALNHEKQGKSIAQKDLMQSTADNSVLSHSRESTNMRRSLITGHVDKSNARHEYPERSSFRHDHTSEADASSRRVLELLQQSQEETTQVRRDLSIMRVERDRLSDQVTVMKRQMERIIDEKEQLSKSLKNSENRMLFRDKQVGIHSNLSSYHFNF